MELSCGHAYCGACLAKLRSKKVVRTLCRAELPSGLVGLYYLAYRAYMRILGIVQRGKVSWSSLPTALQEEMPLACSLPFATCSLPLAPSPSFAFASCFSFLTRPPRPFLFHQSAC